jgi:zinc protease
LKKRETLNRKIPPPIHQVTELNLPTPSVFSLDNGIPVYETRLGTQEIMKIEVVFPAGRPQEHKRLVSRATSRELREGTASYTSAQLAEKVDFYAGTLQTPINMDMGSLTMYCLNKHFEHLVPLFAEMVLQPTFPEKELNTFIENNIQSLIVDLSKNDVLAYRKITEMMFGENHPYGYNSMPDDYRNLTRADLEKHHRELYTTDNCTLFISGKTNDTILKLINQHLGKTKTSVVQQKDTFTKQYFAPQKLKIKNNEGTQSSIRIGNRFGNRKHPDFDHFYVLMTILGGYFGSRLMTNIREKKGYTYNIYASLDVMLEDGFFYISSEVGNPFVKKAINEIYHELDILKTELVGEEELSMVRNYLLGNMLNMVDGAFAVSDVVKSMITEGVPMSSFTQFVDNVKNVTPERLRQLAQKYLNKEDLFEVIVG